MWISVKNRLPDTEVLAIGYQNEMIIGYISPHDEQGFICENDNELLEYVTHWMPLPKPPQDEVL